MNSLGGAPNIQRMDPREFLPDMGTVVNPRVQTNAELNAQDPNIPKVALNMPNFLPERIRNPEAVARGDAMPEARRDQSVPAFKQQAAPAEQPWIPGQPEPEMPADYQRPHHSDFPPSFENPVKELPRGSQVPLPEQGRVPNSTKVPERPLQHPVLAQLVSSLKISTDDLRSATIEGFEFQMRPLPADLYAYAMNMAQRASASNQEMALRFNLLRAVLAIVSINGEPLHEIFGTNTKRFGHFENWAPPVQLVIAYAPKLIDLFFVQLKFKIVEALADEYDKYDIADNNMDLAMPGAVDTSTEERMRFRCNVDGCNHHEDVVPMFLDVQRTSVAPRFCPEHGEVMTPVGFLKDLADIPLE